MKNQAIPPPFHLVNKFWDKAPEGQALDVGCGKGKNTFFLAQNGFRVDAIDTNKENILYINEFKTKENLSISPVEINMTDFNYSKSKYSIVLGIQCFNFIKKSEFKKLIEKIKESLVLNGIIIISLFNTNDPSYLKLIIKNKPQVEENTFFSAEKPNWWHFFKENELKYFFSSEEYSCLFYENKDVQDSGPNPHFHGICEAVFKKKNEESDLLIYLFAVFLKYARTLLFSARIRDATT